MNGLEAAFSDRVDFFVLDVDNPETQAYMEQFAIRGRSTYVLIDAEGNELGRWFGPLNEAGVTAQIENWLPES
ncbi:MAG: hypothetical protein AAF490_16800 [Chloroflexota bacterium]